MKIIFTSLHDLESFEHKVSPASKFIPEWYKKTFSYLNEKPGKPDGQGSVPQTIKRCVPVFDAMVAGYLIPTYADVYVSQKNNQPWFEWSHGEGIQFHAVQQLENHPVNAKFDAPKWINPWGITLPKGYSALFLPPMHQDNKYFEILPGMVDCDEYTSPVNFPFMLKDQKFEGLIPAGTPIAQVIPFKRDKWNMEYGSSKEIKKILATNYLLKNVFINSYRNKWWSRKEFN